MYDDDDFVAMKMCCVCGGGGYNMEPLDAPAWEINLDYEKGESYAEDLGA